MFRIQLENLVLWRNKKSRKQLTIKENLKAKSLAVYFKKFNPAFAIRISMSNYRKDEWIVNVPLVGISGLMKMINENK